MQRYRTGCLKPPLWMKPALSGTAFFIPLSGSRAKEKTRECLSVLPFNFFQLLLDFAFAWDDARWVSHPWDIGLLYAMKNCTSADEVQVSLVTAERCPLIRVTGQWWYQHVIPASLSLEVAFPSLAATPGQQGSTWAATTGIIFAF